MTLLFLNFILNLFFCSYTELNSTGMVAAVTNESATSKAVYFANCTSEMIFITHLLAENPEKLAGPLLADTYVTLLKGRNAWYGHMLAKGELSLDMGDNIKGKGMIQVWLLILECGVVKFNDFAAYFDLKRRFGKSSPLSEKKIKYPRVNISVETREINHKINMKLI